MPRTRRSISATMPAPPGQSDDSLSTDTTYVAHDLRRLGLVLLGTLILLAVTVWVAHTSELLDRFGSSLYKFLNL